MPSIEGWFHWFARAHGLSAARCLLAYEGLVVLVEKQTRQLAIVDFYQKSLKKHRKVTWDIFFLRIP